MPDYVFTKEASFTTLEKGNATPIIRGLRVVDMEGILEKNYRQASEPRYFSFFKRKTRKFPTGLLGLAIDLIRKFNPDASIEINDRVENRVALSPVPADILIGKTLYDWQHETVNKILSAERASIVCATGSGKTLIIMAAMAELLYHNLKVMVIVPTTSILAKTIDNIKKHLDVEAGIYGGNQKILRDVTVITNQSLDAFLRSKKFESRSPIGEAKVKLERDEELREYLEGLDAIFVDEVHLSTAPAWYNACMASNAWFRVGVTGTVDEDSPVRMMRLKAATGSIVARKAAHELIDDGLLARPYIHTITDDSLYGRYKMPNFIEYDSPAAFTKALYDVAVVENNHYNGRVADLIRAMYERGWAVLITCQRKPHFRLLASLMENRNIEFYPCWGETPLGARVEAMENVERDESGIILATKIFDLGIDIPALDAVVLTGGGKAAITLKQRIGRGLRAKTREDNSVRIFDFMDTSCRKLAQHSLERWEIYENEKFDIIPEDDLSDLIERIKKGNI